MAAIKLNGEEFQVGPGATVSSLLEQLELKGDRVAVELDRSIVPRGRWAATKISGGASVEVVHFVGGG
jgi:thiamine biosynthesis protein ThiS